MVGDIVVEQGSYLVGGGWIPVNVGPGTGHRRVGRRRAAGDSAAAGEAFGVVSADAARKRAASSTASAAAGEACGIATTDAARKRAPSSTASAAIGGGGAVSEVVGGCAAGVGAAGGACVGPGMRHAAASGRVGVDAGAGPESHGSRSAWVACAAAAAASRGFDAGPAEIVGERAVADEATGAAAANAGHVAELDGKRCRCPQGE